MKFFIPHLKDDPGAAEAEWKRYTGGAVTTGSRRVYSLVYEHGGAKYVVTVGEQRLKYPRKAGPRGGYIKNADYVAKGYRTGTVVSGIVGGANVIHVWSYGPPFGGWANPSLVGRSTIIEIDYFE